MGRNGAEKKNTFNSRPFTRFHVVLYNGTRGPLIFYRTRNDAHTEISRDIFVVFERRVVTTRCRMKVRYIVSKVGFNS